MASELKTNAGPEQETTPSKPRLAGPERSLKAATIFFSRASGFRLCAAIYGNPIRRDYWIGRLKETLAGRKTLFTVLDFASLCNTGLLHGLRDHLRKEPTPEDWRRAIAVVGLEKRLPDYTAPTGHTRTTNPFLAEANLDRELFLRDCPAPVLLWLTPTGEGALSREAPDFWHWRSHVFDFEETDGPEADNQMRSIEQLENATAGTIYRNRTEMERAAAVFREGLNASLSAHGPAHPSTCKARVNLGNVLYQLGDYQQAKDLFQENLDELKKRPVTTSEELGPTLAGLGLLLRTLGKFAEAEPLYRRALEIDEESYGKDHPEVAADLNNLATLLEATNRLTEAEPLYRRALEIDEKSYGKDHPTVATRLNNLAGLLEATNRLAEAEPLYRRALEINEKSYGKDHPTVAIRLNNLAGLLEATNRLAEAEPLYRRALEIDEKSYGKDHPDVATDLNNLAGLLSATNRRAEAEPLYRQAVRIFVEFQILTGHQHPHLKQAIKNYRGLLMKMERTQEEADAEIQKVTMEAEQEASKGK